MGKKKDKRGLMSISDSLAALILKRNKEKGVGIKIPSLDIIIINDKEAENEETTNVHLD